MSRALRATGLQIALVAMIVRALVPAGWMPVPSTSGALFTICTINGPLKISLDLSGKPETPKAPHDDERHHILCHFACSAAAHTPPALASTAFLPLSGQQRSHHDVRIVIAGAQLGPHAPRAPPALA